MKLESIYHEYLRQIFVDREKMVLQWESKEEGICLKIEFKAPG